MMEEVKTRRNRNKLKHYVPYAKQLEFHNDKSRERLLMAGNQLGKTFCGAADTSIHLTGRYPDWWDGVRFERPIRMWAGSKLSLIHI